jgi:excisionase family DNA binding protein
MQSAAADTDTSVARSTPNEQQPQWMTPEEAARYIGKSTWFIYEQIKQGNIPYRRIGKKNIFIPREFFDPSHAQKQVTE